MNKQNILVRFWKLVDIRNGPCWGWIGYKNKKGYGCFKVDKKVLKAHRFSYMKYIGPIPSGLCVCHKCDNPSCVNPNHLFVGTNHDNIIDKVNKKRCAKGEKHSRLKLTWKQVKEIRLTFIKRDRIFGSIALSKKYNVNSSTILRIINGTIWKTQEEK